mmetsp:Transcript_78/g.114  ORF Transcript_78/g.114 Transcript_78/m.114 type:complete len:149 (-) Transcript_78:82-528(-)
MARRVPKEFLAQFVGGKWRPPQIRPRHANALRKAAVIAGRVVPGADLKRGEWDPEWTLGNKAVVLREPKGHKRERTKADRVARIEEAMESMDQKISEYHLEKKAEVPKSFYDQQLTKMGYFKVGEEPWLEGKSAKAAGKNKKKKKGKK